MTDSEKLDLILEKMISLDQKTSALERKVKGLEENMVDAKADLRHLRRDVGFILDEVESVHVTLDKYKVDKTAHTA